MGASKNELFSDLQNEMAAYAKALAHPARIAILHYLIDKKTCVCGYLVEETGLAQPTVSQHLKELKNVGLIKGTIEGKNVCYCIDTDNWNKFTQIFKQFLNHNPALNHQQNCC